jgi:hypothetical protein
MPLKLTNVSEEFANWDSCSDEESWECLLTFLNALPSAEAPQLQAQRQQAQKRDKLETMDGELTGRITNLDEDTCV